ncbi:MAG: hypothetical protein WB562_00620, partial [Candidatus Sulfotelmatobacter sp.]
TVLDPAGPAFVAVNPVTHKAYVPGGFSGSGDITVITELPAPPIPLQVRIHPLPLNETNNPTPTFSLTATDTFAPNPTVIDGVLYQVDTMQGAWLKAKNIGAGKYKGRIANPLALGMHILYAYATDGQEGTVTNTDPGASPLVGSVAAYAFLIY